MASNSKIEWCDHTFNPWTGCTKISPACANCYAESWAKRSGLVEWGPGKPRRHTSAANWRQVHKWNRDAEATGRRPKVFCASLADWLDDEVPIEWLVELLELIRRTPHLDWLLLSKRPRNFFPRLGAALAHIGSDSSTASWLESWIIGDHLPDNVWIGVTVEDQEQADLRVPMLRRLPARIRFLSCEPLLSPLDLRDGLGLMAAPGDIDWIIAGGESGPHARPLHPGWLRHLRDQAIEARVPFLFKQWGEHTSAGVRVGKAKAGRLLSGREWNQFPTSA
jgi:protein gp37